MDLITDSRLNKLCSMRLISKAEKLNLICMLTSSDLESMRMGIEILKNIEENFKPSVGRSYMVRFPGETNWEETLCEIGYGFTNKNLNSRLHYGFVKWIPIRNFSNLPDHLK